MGERSLQRERVLRSPRRLERLGFGVLLEGKGSRLDLPSESFESGQKSEGQRRRTLCYPDAIIHTNRTPRVLIAVVDSSPKRPNGIADLVVNVDRVAEIHANIDLIFIVSAEMKESYCSRHGRGHRLSSTEYLACLKSLCGTSPDDRTLGALIHHGKAMEFKKTLVDYPISSYLRNISPPPVLFLNKTKVKESWDTYQRRALRLVEDDVEYIVSAGKRCRTRLVAIGELLPDHTLELWSEFERSDSGSWPAATT